MSFTYKEKFITDYIEKQEPRVVKAVQDYLDFAHEHGVRMCDDGFPDTRFKGTYEARHLKARKFIARIREYYCSLYPHPAHVANRRAKLQVR